MKMFKYTLDGSNLPNCMFLVNEYGKLSKESKMLQKLS